MGPSRFLLLMAKQTTLVMFVSIAMIFGGMRKCESAEVDKFQSTARRVIATVAAADQRRLSQLISRHDLIISRNENMRGTTSGSEPAPSKGLYLHLNKYSPVHYEVTQLTLTRQDVNSKEYRTIFRELGQLVSGSLHDFPTGSHSSQHMMLSDPYSHIGAASEGKVAAGSTWSIEYVYESKQWKVRKIEYRMN
jgi:hypothetical protein